MAKNAEELILYMIEQYVGTIGSGKSYHALEVIVDSLRKGKYVIGNFPLKFSDALILNGCANRYMYLSDDVLLGDKGMNVLFTISEKMGWDKEEEEGLCLVVLDEAHNFFPATDFQKDVQRRWQLFFTQSRKMGYDFILISQDDRGINRTIRKCVEYVVYHRKANNVFPFSLLPFTIFYYVTYWNKNNPTRLKSESSIFVKRLAQMYNSKRFFADLDVKFREEDVQHEFGNCVTQEDLKELNDRLAKKKKMVFKR